MENTQSTRRVSCFENTVIALVDSAPLGRIISLLSTDNRWVLKIWISFTLPSKPWAEMKSPTLKGRNSMIITPPAKFCKVPLKAIPIANPADANKATNELVLMPKMPTMAKMRKNVNRTDTRLIKKVLSEASALRYNIAFDKPFLISLMTHRPKM